MLAGHVMNVEPGLRDDLVGVVELRCRRQMADVAGVDHEGGLGRQRIDLGDALLKRAERIGIRRLEVEADMAVADLQERQPARFLRRRLVDKAQRMRNAAGNGPKHAGSDPSHAFENFAPADAVIAIEFAHCLSPLKPWRLLRTRSGNRGVYSRRGNYFSGRASAAAAISCAKAYEPRRARQQRERHAAIIIAPVGGNANVVGRRHRRASGDGGRLRRAVDHRGRAQGHCRRG